MGQRSAYGFFWFSDWVIKLTCCERARRRITKTRTAAKATVARAASQKDFWPKDDWAVVAITGEDTILSAPTRSFGIGMAADSCVTISADWT